MVSSKEISRRLKEKRRGQKVKEKTKKFCPGCGAENSMDANFCRECGEEIKKIFSTNGIVSWLNKCPVCKKGNLLLHKKKSLGFTSNTVECEFCNAVFTQKKDGYKLSKVSNKSNITWLEYGNETLSGREWTNIATGVMSVSEHHDLDIEQWLMETKEGLINFPEPESHIILKNNENVILVLGNISLREPKAVIKTRGIYGGPRIGVSKGVSLGLGGILATSESHEELRTIDQGFITLTNNRLVFTGEKRTTNIDLKKIIAIKPFKDGISCQRENKPKTEYFIGTDNSVLNIAVDGRKHNIPVSGLVLKYILEGFIKRQ